MAIESGDRGFLHALDLASSQDTQPWGGLLRFSGQGPRGGPQGPVRRMPLFSLSFFMLSTTHPLRKVWLDLNFGDCYRLNVVHPLPAYATNSYGEA